MKLTSIPGDLAGREISVCPSLALDSWKPSSAEVQWAAVSRWEREIRLAPHSGREREPRLKGNTLLQWVFSRQSQGLIYKHRCD